MITYFINLTNNNYNVSLVKVIDIDIGDIIDLEEGVLYTINNFLRRLIF